MNKIEAEEIVETLDLDERQDLLMFLAEEFDLRVLDDEEDKTYFLSSF